MKLKWFPFINLGLAVVMLFFALPKMGMSTDPLANAFWVIWVAFSSIVIAANGNIILMSEDKRERLKQIKRQRSLRFEKKLAGIMKSKVNNESNKKKVKETAS